MSTHCAAVEEHVAWFLWDTCLCLEGADYERRGV